MLSRQAATINGVGLSKDHEDQSRLSYLSSTFWEQTSRNEVIAAREFLWLVATVIDWSHALLLLLTLGKSKVQKLSEYERVILIKYLKEHRISLECSEFKEKATAENLGQLSMNSSLKVLASAKLSQKSAWNLEGNAKNASATTMQMPPRRNSIQRILTSETVFVQLRRLLTSPGNPVNRSLMRWTQNQNCLRS